jgi:hypothetical protein
MLSKPPQNCCRIAFFLIVLLLSGAAPIFAQKVVTQDAGGGSKLELHYDASGKVVETRTIGADGKLLEKDTLEYLPGYYVPQTLATSYWPNGKLHKVTHNTYDANSNFTGEFVQVFDDAGKQIGGHRVSHDPQTNTYTCTEWNTAAQAYKPLECPVQEEEESAPEAVKTFTAEEVTQQLARARQAAQQPSNNAPTGPPRVQAGNVTEAALIFPAHPRAGERISGSVVDDPKDYASSPEVSVTPVALPLATSGKAATLAGWQVEIAGQAPQPADGPITLTVPAGQSREVILRQADHAGAPVSKTINFAGARGLRAAASAKNKSAAYLAPAICVKGQVCVIHGAFSGDSSEMFAAFGPRPAKILAASSDAAFIAIPDLSEPGPRPLVIAEGTKAVAFPTTVVECTIRPDRREISKGQVQLMYQILDGPSELPDAEWRPGNFPPSNLEQARQLLPGSQAPGAGAAREKHEAEERREHEERAAKEERKTGDSDATSEKDADEGGEILLVVKNVAPDIADFRDSKNGMFVFHLNAASFKFGEFKYKYVVEAKENGNFGVRAWIIPLLAPVKGQEFPMTAAAAK